MENLSWNKTADHPKEGGRVELEPGTRLGRYEILRLLGRGGMGQVYLARHELQKTLHALKILPSEFSGRAGFVERFRTELQTMARLQHSNIVHVQYSDVEAGLYYLVMDFIAADGTEEPYDLEEALAVEKRLEPETVRRLMLRLCDGLSFAHGQGVVHRDLKPANVLLTSKDLSAADVKICDFGLARVVGEEQVRTMVAQSMQRSMSMGDQDTFTEKKRSERSSTGSVMGTYGYMSPEQEEGKPADERSDLYSLGVMMYRMITGQRLRGRAKAPSAVVQGLDKAWDAIIDKCLENDPAARWQTAVALKAALDAGGRVTQGSSKVLKFGSSKVKGNKAWLWLAGAAVIAVVSILSVRAIHSSNAKRAEAARAAAASAALDAAQREKVAGLEAAVEAALAAGDLKTADSKIAELGQAGGATALRKRYESKAGESDTNKRSAVASMAREEAMKLDAGQGFGEKLKALETAWREAEAARQSQGWTQAVTGYDAVIASSKTLKDAEVSREGAKTRRGEAEKAKSDAEQSQSATDAADLYAAGGRGCVRAAGAFEKGDFDVASKDWQEAAQSYASAQKRALAAQDCRKVKESFEEALARDRALLEKYGGSKWAEVKLQQKAGEASSSDPAEGSRAYGLALAALPGAVAEAGKAQQADAEYVAAQKKAADDKKAKEQAEAERLAEEQKAIAAKAQRQKDFDGEMVSGKSAWDKADYSTAYKAYKKALVLCPGDSAAQTNYCQVDAMLSRLNPYRTAKKGCWVKRAYTTKMKMSFPLGSNSTTTQEEIQFLDVGEDVVVTRNTLKSSSSMTIAGGYASETVTEHTQNINEAFGEAKSTPIRQITNGKDSTASIKSTMEKLKTFDEKREFLGCETIRIGAQEYTTKCLLKSEKRDFGSGMQTAMETKYWISEDTIAPTLKHTIRVKVYNNSNTSLLSESFSTVSLVSLSQEDVTVNGRVLKCRKEVRVTENQKDGTTGTFTSWECLDYPWIGMVKKESVIKGKNFTSTASDILESFGLGS